MLPASAYRQNRVRIERKAVHNDGRGNVTKGWNDPLVIAERWASFRPKFGNETLEADRLQTTMSGVLTLRRDGQSTGIVASDRVVFVYGPQAGAIGQIRSIVPTPDNREIEMVIETGVAV